MFVCGGPVEEADDDAAPEEKLDEKTAELIHLQRVTMEHNANSPIKNEELNEALGNWSQGDRSRNGENGAVQLENPPKGSFKKLETPTKNLQQQRVSNTFQSVQGGNILSGSVTSKSTKEQGAALSPERKYVDQRGQRIPPSQLLKHKQYEPYHDTVVFVGDSKDGDNSNRLLLSGDEKIKELSRIIELQNSERKKLAQELEEVQAEKVSVEYLLREKLEKLVQSEIEARLRVQKHQNGATASSQNFDNAGNGHIKSNMHARIQALSQQHASFRLDMNAKYERQNEQIMRLEAENNELRGLAHQDRTVDSNIATMTEQMETYRKERKAIQTIMESKIKALADNIASATKAVIDDSVQNSVMPSREPPAPAKQLSREVQALQRLVNAAITALRNATE